MEKKWMILAGSFLIMTLIPGFLRSMNVFYVDLIETFSATHAEAAMVQSSVASVFGLSVFTGPFINRLGIRRSGFIGTFISSLSLVLAYFVNRILLLTLILGIWAGVGYSTLYIAAQASVGVYFEGKSKPMAMSFVIFAAGIGGMCLPYLMAYLVDKYGVRGALLIYGGMLTNCVLLFVAIGSQYKTDTDLNIEINDQQQIKQTKNKDSYIFAERSDTHNVQSKTLDQEKDEAKNKYVICYQSSGGVMMITLINATSTIARLLPGILEQIPKMNVLVISVVMSFIGGVSAICLPFTTNYSILVFLFSVISGLCQGSFTAIRSLCIVKLVGDEQFALAIGMAMSILGTGVMLAGPIAGLIKDIWGSYDITFFVCGGTMLTSGVILTIAFIYSKSH